MDCNLPGSSVHGIFQARVLEWVAIAFSSVQFSSLDHLCLTLCDPMDCNLPGSSLHGILQARVLESNIEIYNTICKNSQWEFAVCLRELKQGLYNRLKGGMGRKIRGRSGTEGTRVYLWLILVIQIIKNKSRTK